MAENTVPIKKDVDGQAIPQYYNPLTDAYEVLQGKNGANRIELYDASGNPVDLAALITAVSNKDFATQTTLLAIEAKLTSIEAEIAAIKLRLGERLDYYGKSLDPRPSGVSVGTTFFVIDKLNVEMWDGQQWVVI